MSFWITGAAMSNQVAAATPTPLAVYTYHDRAPYFSRVHQQKLQQISTLEQIAREQGMYQTLIGLINRQQQDYLLELKYIPRKRLNSLLESGDWQGAVIGANPQWFSDIGKRRYLWSRAIVHDRDVFVVRNNSTIKYQKPEDMMGRKLAMPRGFYYAGITELVRQGHITTVETSNALQDLRLLLSGRVEVAIMSPLTLAFFERHFFRPDSFRRLPLPQAEFARHLFFSPMSMAEYEQLQPVIDEVISGRDWHYYLLELGCQVPSSARKTPLTPSC